MQRAKKQLHLSKTLGWAYLSNLADFQKAVYQSSISFSYVKYIPGFQLFYLLFFLSLSLLFSFYL